MLFKLIREFLDRIADNHLKAENRERKFVVKFIGTRVVEVALRMYEDDGHNEYLFWYQPDSVCNEFFRKAQNQLAADLKCWSKFYKWTRRLQKSLYPIAWLLNYLNNNLKLPFICHHYLYFWSQNLDYNTGNWNIISEL